MTASAKAVPPRKPINEHKQSGTWSIDPNVRRWLRENFGGLGFRSESHAVEEAIRRLKESAPEKKKGNP